jgi:predicted nucleic acid-binding Zn ribbon protein
VKKGRIRRIKKPEILFWKFRSFCQKKLGVLRVLVVNFRVPPPKKISARQKVLAQWRGVDLAPIEIAKTVRARDAEKIVSKVLAGLKMDSRRADIEIVKVWNELLDPNITAHAQPHNLHKGTLFVNVDSSVWLSEIVRYRRKEILDRLQHSFGKNLIQKISFRIG